MPLVGAALNLQEKMKIYSQVLTFFVKPQFWLFHVVVLLTTAKKWTKVTVTCEDTGVDMVANTISQ